MADVPDDVAARLAAVKDRIGYQAEARRFVERLPPWLRQLLALGALWSRPRGSAALIRAQGEAFSAMIRAAGATSGRCSCGHTRAEHSEQLVGQPCLECDCPGHMPGGGPSSRR